MHSTEESHLYIQTSLIYPPKLHKCPFKQFSYISDILLYINFLKIFCNTAQSTLDTCCNYTTFLFVVKYKSSSFQSADRQGCGRCRLYCVLRYQKCLHYRKRCYRIKIPEYTEGNEEIYVSISIKFTLTLLQHI